jgi:hypothetical protein
VVAGARRVRAVLVQPEQAGRRRLCGVELPEIGAKDDHHVGDVGMVVRAKGLLVRDDALDDRLSAFGVLERVQLAAEGGDERLDLVGSNCP